MSWPIVVEKGSPKHRLWQVVGYGLVVALILWIAFRMENYQILNFANVAAYSVAILGLMLIIGYSGQISIGQSFFFGLGAYTTAYLGVDHSWNFLLTLPVSAALGLRHRVHRRHPGAAHPRPLPGARDARARRGVPGAWRSSRPCDDITGGANGKPADVIVWKNPGWTPGNLSNQAWQFLVLCAIGRGHVPARLEHDEEPARADRSSRSATARSGRRSAACGRPGGRWVHSPISAAYGAIGGSMLVFVVRDRRTRDRWLHDGDRPAHRCCASAASARSRARSSARSW